MAGMEILRFSVPVIFKSFIGLNQYAKREGPTEALNVV
jgi:hypothetical protein